MTTTAFNVDAGAWRSMFTASHGWQTVDSALDEFMPLFRGTTVAQAGQAHGQ